ncbi:hypothetical protein FQR65_LT20699 [Abscondita terminalis]|nr:hypothetical protein FQR65_LT20699 [Abscondita terminalis]
MSWGALLAAPGPAGRGPVQAPTQGLPRYSEWALPVLSGIGVAFLGSFSGIAGPRPGLSSPKAFASGPSSRPFGRIIWQPGAALMVDPCQYRAAGGVLQMDKAAACPVCPGSSSTLPIGAVIGGWLATRFGDRIIAVIGMPHPALRVVPAAQHGIASGTRGGGPHEQECSSAWPPLAAGLHRFSELRMRWPQRNPSRQESRISLSCNSSCCNRASPPPSEIVQANVRDHGGRPVYIAAVIAIFVGSHRKSGHEGLQYARDTGGNRPRPPRRGRCHPAAPGCQGRPGSVDQAGAQEAPGECLGHLPG